MRKNLLVSLAVSLLFLSNAYGQEMMRQSGTKSPINFSLSRRSDKLMKLIGQQTDPLSGQENAAGHVCADNAGQTSGTHRFNRVGEKIAISLRAQSVSTGAADCEPVALDLEWSNGRNNGSNFSVTFLDNNNRAIYTKSFWAFMTGNLELDLASLEFRPVYGSSMMVSSVPASVTIQAVQPFAAPASLSYAVVRMARRTGAGGSGSAGSPRGQPAGGASRQKEKPTLVEGQQRSDANQGNEVVSIRNVVRLIGASKLPLVQIELKTAHPFPIKEVPLQLQIGKRVFVDELSGDYTGRRLTLSLTPEMFAALQDGDEIVASFGKREGNESADQNVWYFGKLVKNSRQ